MPTHSSTVSIAFTAALILPVCPTISGFAKFITINAYFPLLIALEQLIVNSLADISGAKSYVATLGEGIKCLSSPSEGISTPPLKKYVTCGYFSVSAVRYCLSPCSETIWPMKLFNDSGGNATCTERLASY